MKERKEKKRKNEREDYRLKFTHENRKDGCWHKGRAAVWLAVRQSGARSFCSNIDKQARETRLSLRLMEAHCLPDSPAVSPLANPVVIITAICLISNGNYVLCVHTSLHTRQSAP